MSLVTIIACAAILGLPYALVVLRDRQHTRWLRCLASVFVNAIIATLLMLWLVDLHVSHELAVHSSVATMTTLALLWPRPAEVKR